MKFNDIFVFKVVTVLSLLIACSNCFGPMLSEQGPYYQVQNTDLVTTTDGKYVLISTSYSSNAISYLSLVSDTGIILAKLALSCPGTGSIVTNRIVRALSDGLICAGYISCDSNGATNIGYLYKVSNSLVITQTATIAGSKYLYGIFNSGTAYYILGQDTSNNPLIEYIDDTLTLSSITSKTISLHTGYANAAIIVNSKIYVTGTAIDSSSVNKCMLYIASTTLIGGNYFTYSDGSSLKCSDIISDSTGIIYMLAIGVFPIVDSYVVKTDSAGTKIWGKRLGGTCDEKHYRLIRYSDTKIYAIGNIHCSFWKAFRLVSFDNNGNIAPDLQWFDSSYASIIPYTIQEVQTGVYAMSGVANKATFASLFIEVINNFCFLDNVPTGAGGSCVACASGWKRPRYYQSTCSRCYVGDYQPSTGVCTSCPTGSKCAPIDTASPTQCSTGEYQDVARQSYCKWCDPGYYNDQLGKTACTMCPAGTYQDLRGMGSCKDCPAGTYSASQGATICTNCPAGKLTALNKQSCLDTCPAGTIPNSNGNACENCPAGTYQALLTDTSCTPCSKGYAQGLSGKVSCDQCSPGYYTDVEGSTSCKACLPGTYQGSNGGQFCNNCGKGTYSSGGVPTCSICEKGFFSANLKQSACDQCPEGTYANTRGAIACTSCLEGYYANAKASQICSPCPVGTYTNTKETITCTQCEPGKYQDQTGQTSCKLCPAGTFNNSPGSDQLSDCTQCPVGYFSAVDGLTVCDQCPEGKYQDQPGKTLCIACPINTYSNTKARSKLSDCIACTAGSYTSTIGSTSCTPCAKGTYMDAATPGTCTDCPAGTFNENLGKAGSCDLCPAGTANPNMRSTVASDCVECPLGTFSTIQSSSCTNCPVGTYQDAVKQNSCKQCLAGTANALTKRTAVSDCIPCNAGYWSAASSEFCVACLENEYQPQAGQSSCLPCPEHSTSSSGAIKCTCNPGTYKTTEIPTICIPCPPHSYNDGTTPFKCKVCPPGTYQPEPGMTYCESLLCGLFCIACTDPQTCTKCDETNAGLVLKNGACSCEASGYSFAINPITGKPNCVKCHPLCLTCYGNLNTECKSCNSQMNAILQNENTCQCKAGYFYDEATASCLECSNLCKECKGPAFYDCLLCNKKTSIPVEGSPNKCVASCEVGFYKDYTDQPICKSIFNSFGEYLKLGCHSDCKSCIGKNSYDCTECSNSNQMMLNGKCTYDCGPGYYASPSRICLSIFSNYKIFIDCHESCLECKTGSLSGCTKCRLGKFLVNGQCVDQCPIGTYQNITECLPCVTCFTCTSKEYCLSCQYPLMLFSNTHECLYPCPAGYYGDEQTTTCKKCYFLCTKCHDSTTCTECIEGYTLDASGKCSQILCNDGFYQELRPKVQCLPCHKSCKKCSGPLRNQCIECKLGYFYKQVVNSPYYSCVSCEEINPGYFTNNEGKCQGIFFQKFI